MRPLSFFTTAGTAAVLVASLRACNGFAFRQHTVHYSYPSCRRHTVQRSLICHRMSSESYNDGDDYSSVARNNNDARLDIRNLATQRAIQNLLYLCESMRDPISVKWIEDFLNTTNALEYHGLGARYMAHFGGNWDGPLLEMIERPREVVVVSKRRNRGTSHHGLATMPSEREISNPYLEDRFVEYDIDIDPVSLANRILSIREQIAKEWVAADLDIIAAANDEILGSYLKLAREERERKDNGREQLESPSPQLAFERTAALVFNDKVSFVGSANSLLRSANFDLLCNLCTQVSVHRLLRELREEGGETKVQFQWLSEFYENHLADYFDGDHAYGRADDFLELLLRAPPSVIKMADGTAGLADPMALAEQIIEKRGDIVKEWKGIMRRVPQDHSDGIRRLIMDKQLEAWGSSPSGMDESSQEGFE